MIMVCPLPTEAAGIMGIDFLDMTGAEISLECVRMALAAIGEATSTNSISQAKCAALTAFTEGKAGSRPQPTGQEEL